MGLLLSILVFSVGVMEVIACIRHIQYGYLPEWAPRRHVFATGTSGITKLREHWRKKPSKSVGYDNKTKINRHDVTRSCDIPCYGDECQELVNSCVQSEKLKSPLQQVKDACAANFRPLTSEVGEFNLTYQEFEEVLPRGANTFSELEDSTINQDHALCNNSLQDVSAQIAENRGSKIDQIQSDFDYSLPYHENIVVEEQRFPASGLQSPSPLRSKVDISWPLSTPHSLISRRPSTPTTAEEDGGQSPYYGGEFLTEEHIKSTQRPLSIRTDTYHCDQDITPIFVDDTDVDGAVSVNRPLTIASRADEFQTALNVDNECANIIPKNNVEIIRDTPSALNIGTHTSSLEACNAYTLQNTDTENTMITKSEEAKALELCINQKRRTSKTEYLPHSEELATTILQKELTSEISFAAKKEEPTHLNPTKATSFEEARVESFEAEPLYIGVSEPVHNEARRSSIISTINLDDVSVISGSLQIKAPDDPITLAKTIENEDSVMSKTQQEKNVVKRKGVKFNDPDVSDLEDEIPRFDEKETYIKFDISPRKETIDKYDIRRLVEITAMTLVDEIVEEAIERLIGNHNSSEEDEEWRTEETEVPGKFADRECVRNGQLVKLHDESSFKLDNTLVVQDTKVTNTVPDTSSKNLAENTSRLCALDDTEQDNGKVNKSPLLVTKSKFTENINDDNAYSKNDSGETKILEENTSKKSKLTNTLESQQEDETQFNISASFLTPTTSLTDSEKVVEGGIASEYDTSRPSKTHGEIITEKDELSIAECSSSSSSSLAKSVGVTESSSKNSSANIPVTRDDAISDQASAGQSKGSEKIEKTSTQQPGQQPSKQAPEAFWVSGCDTSSPGSSTSQ